MEYEFVGKRAKPQEEEQMRLFHMKEKTQEHTYDGQQPVLKSSICTGETVAGFLDEGGKLQEVMLIAGEEDLALFCRKYGVAKEEIKHIF